MVKNGHPDDSYCNTRPERRPHRPHCPRPKSWTPPRFLRNVKVQLCLNFESHTSDCASVPEIMPVKDRWPAGMSRRVRIVAMEPKSNIPNLAFICLAKNLLSFPQTCFHFPRLVQVKQIEDQFFMKSKNAEIKDGHLDFRNRDAHLCFLQF